MSRAGNQSASCVTQQSRAGVLMRNCIVHRPKVRKCSGNQKVQESSKNWISRVFTFDCISGPRTPIFFAARDLCRVKILSTFIAESDSNPLVEYSGSELSKITSCGPLPAVLPVMAMNTASSPALLESGDMTNAGRALVAVRSVNG